jgi:hypothetical protein
MKQIILSLLLVSTICHSQNVTIDYESWNPAGTTCSLFVNPTNVPASVGGTLGTIEHQRKLGETRYINADLSIQMQTTFQPAGLVLKGARFRIAYSFKANYSYIIYVTAAALENTIGSSTGPYLRLDANNNAGGGSTGCNGPESLTASIGGNPAAIQLASNNYQEFQIIFPQLGTQSTLEVTAFPAQNGGTKTVRIRKIKILETPPPPTFTLSPASINIPCGSSTSQTFTVTNVYNTSGVTNHLWNLGSNSNGWLHNGSAAPQYISTGTNNTLTLTPSCDEVKQNIAVTVTATGNNYQTNTSSVTNSSPSLTISGNSVLCTGSASYSLSNVPCNATVLWTSSNTGIATIASSGNPATLTRIGNGTVTITATVNGISCLSNNSTLKTIAVGYPQASNIVIWNSSSSTTVGNPVGFVAGYPPDNRCLIQGTEWQSSLSASMNSGDFPCEPDNETSKNIFFQESGTAYIQARVQNSCGWSDWSAAIPIQVNQGYFYLVAPNPASSTLIIKNKDNATYQIKEVKIFDNIGNLKKQSKYDIGTFQVQLNVSDLRTGHYFIEISNGKFKRRQELIIQR